MKFRDLVESTSQTLTQDYKDNYVECFETGADFTASEANKIIKRMEKDGWKCWKNKYVPKYYFIMVRSPYQEEETHKMLQKYGIDKIFFCQD